MVAVKPKKTEEREDKSRTSLLDSIKTILASGSASGKNLSKRVSKPGTDSNAAFFSPSYMFHNGHYMSILTLYCRPGTNRYMEFDDVLDIIPVNTEPDVTLTMLVKDMLLEDSFKRKTVRQNALSQTAAIEDTQDNGDKTENDKANVVIQACDLEDYDDYMMVVDSAVPVVCFKIQLIVSAETRESVENQIDDLNLVLSQRHEGLVWDSTAGEQRECFQAMLTSMVPSRHDNSSTGSNYAALNFSISPGLSDPEGVPIGVDAMSLTRASSLIDFDGSLHKLAVLAASQSSAVPHYKLQSNGDHISAGSVFAQAIANHACIRGHRAHHIVLNDFNYFDNAVFYRPDESCNIFKQYDVSSLTINPLQGFGDIEDVVNVFDRLTRKIVNIFDVLEDFKLSTEDKSIILTALKDFYTNRKLWNADAALYPKRTRIVNITNPSTFPTLGEMINSFTNLANDAANRNRENKSDKIETLYNTLDHALISHMSVLGRTTSIKQTDAIQVYYDFSKIESKRIKHVQLLNMIEYVIWTASKGDVIVLHGCDSIYKTVFTHLCGAFEAAWRKGVRIVTSFDAITPSRDSIDELSGIFDLKGYLYQDLDTDVDYSIIGRCLSDEVDRFETALNTPLSASVRNNLLGKDPSQFLVHRADGGVNNFVYANTVI